MNPQEAALQCGQATATFVKPKLDQWEARMEREETNRELDRRTALVLGLTGISALVLGATSAAAAEAAKEIAPGVKLTVLK